MKKIRLLILFYRNFCFASTLITFACVFLFWEYGPDILSVLFCLKTISLLIISQFIRTYKTNEFYYYRNLGVSKPALWLSTISFDLAAYFTLISLVNKCR